MCVIRLNAPTSTTLQKYRSGADTRDRAIYDVSYTGCRSIIDLYRRGG